MSTLVTFVVLINRRHFLSGFHGGGRNHSISWEFSQNFLTRPLLRALCPQFPVFSPAGMSTVILGAGIIGLSTAHHLASSPSCSTPPKSIHLVDPSPRLFASTSGHAAGFLARDWFSPSVAALGALSFDLHKQLADEHGGLAKWGYSQSTATSLVNGRSGESAEIQDWLRAGGSRVESASEPKHARSSARPPWLNTAAGDVRVVSEEGTTAQV